MYTFSSHEQLAEQGKVCLIGEEFDINGSLRKDELPPKPDDWLAAPEYREFDWGFIHTATVNPDGDHGRKPK